MDRLSLVVGLALVAASCADERGPAPPRERVNAVRAKPERRAALGALCDRYFDADGPEVAWPKLDTAAPAGASDRWQWINVWATWCKPCVEELPRLLAWRDRLADRATLILVSADSSPAEVDAFRAAHPGMPTSRRIESDQGLVEWMARLGTPGATLPLHVFVDTAGRLRCVRTSSLEDHDLPAVRALLDSQ